MVFFCCDFHLRIDVVNLRPHREGAMYYSKYKSSSLNLGENNYCDTVSGLKRWSVRLQMVFSVIAGRRIERCLSAFISLCRSSPWNKAAILMRIVQLRVTIAPMVKVFDTQGRVLKHKDPL
ncbi:hypothetical protein P8452_58064 [Trifolium repens]|nr:hypothetical protein P8452_58064 [Trifolium repens]